ncbi:hypothetical protein GCM10010954_26100 [Halobacillus andaensis]|uniref:Pectate lyase superfamily protein domain-containing protein n=1 Tax=Halobacillus andaensis TaxID=1176239 RepID=A0A917B6H4_HALAA|nr:hypothetical protein [Halobacillus andaensis]MBP2005804.1 hypothetical protein [Halobacillus andaensis]GGF25933.1 hypothetical protein GCM10010954_26100 [Halobacillus andaensis]
MLNSKRNVVIALLLVLLCIGVIYQWMNTGKELEASKDTMHYVNVEDFGAKANDEQDDSKAIQEAIDYSVENNISEVRLNGNRDYNIERSIILKSDIQMKLGTTTRLLVEGDFRVIEIMKNAGITGGIIEITDDNFNSEVVYLSGSQKFWSWEKTSIEELSIINSSGSNKGLGLMLHAEKSDHHISFVNFININIVGFHTGVKLQADKPENQYSFVNGNRFANFTLDNCVHFIEFQSSITVPNEVSGNQFTGLQIQPSESTEKILTVTGSDNYFEGMIWDPEEYIQDNQLIEFTEESMRNKLESNLNANKVNDLGDANSILARNNSAE